MTAIVRCDSNVALKFYLRWPPVTTGIQFINHRLLFYPRLSAYIKSWHNNTTRMCIARLTGFKFGWVLLRAYQPTPSKFFLVACVIRIHYHKRNRDRFNHQALAKSIRMTYYVSKVSPAMILLSQAAGFLTGLALLSQALVTSPSLSSQPLGSSSAFQQQQQHVAGGHNYGLFCWIYGSTYLIAFLPRLKVVCWK